MALALGKSLAWVGRLTAAEVRQWRRFYARHPFGPVRGDMQAWLAGIIARGAKISLQDAASIFSQGPTPRRRKRKAKPKPEKPRLTSDKLRAICLALGGTIVEGKPDVPIEERSVDLPPAD